MERKLLDYGGLVVVSQYINANREALDGVETDFQQFAQLTTGVLTDIQQVLETVPGTPLTPEEVEILWGGGDISSGDDTPSDDEPKLPEIGKALEEYDWSEISAISKAGQASEYFNIGDTKSISFNGEDYLVQIIGFDHDDVSDESAYGKEKAGITFQFGVADSSSQVGMYATTYPMNSTDANANGWRGSVMRTSTMPLMKGYLPSDLQSVLVTVNKVSGVGGTSSSWSGTETTQDDLFLLAEVEIFGETTYSVSGEGEQYQFYDGGNSTVRRRSGGSATYWWERSPVYGNTSGFCYVDSKGKADYYNAKDSDGVSFGFCV